MTIEVPDCELKRPIFPVFVAFKRVFSRNSCKLIKKMGKGGRFFHSRGPYL